MHTPGVRRSVLDDRILQRFLTINGLNMINSKSTLVKCSKRIITSVLYTCAFQLILCPVIRFCTAFSLLELYYLFFAFMCLLQWFIIFSRARNLSRIFYIINRNRYSMNIKSNKSKFVINIIIFLNALLLWTSTMRIFFIEAFDLTQKQSMFWTCKCKIKNEIIKYTIIFFNLLCFYVFSLYLPVLVTLLICTMLWRLSELFKYFSRRLCDCVLRDDIIRVDYLLMQYTEFIEVVKKLNVLLSTPLFFLFLCTSANIFYVTSFDMIYPGDVGYRMLDCIICVTGATSMLLALSICGSFVPDSMMEIRIIVERLLEKFGKSLPKESDTLFYLERVEKKVIDYLNACGIIRFEKKLIFTVYGALLTYGLLIINLTN